MSSQHYSRHAAQSGDRSLFSWPPSPALLGIQLVARTILIPNDIIGLSLLFVTAHRSGRAAAIVGGSFLTIALFFVSIFWLWNLINLRRAKRAQEKQSMQVETGDRKARKACIGGLKFVTFMDGLGAIFAFSSYIPILVDSLRSYWGWRSDSQHFVVYAYGSAAILVAFVTHFFLFITQLKQLYSALQARKNQKLVCPHCNHTMTNLFSNVPTPQGSDAGSSCDILGESLVDAIAPRISMDPGQETGTTFKTPRQSEHQSRAVATRIGEANETGEGESDNLITKSG